MRVLVTGATGYIGGRLVPALVAAGHEVRVFARDAGRLEGRFPGVEIAKGDIFDGASVAAALAGCELAYYLVHSMAEGGDFAASDREAAETFGTAARETGLKRIVYLGGLGQDGENLSHHLKSRHEVGDLLRASGVPVTEFRAAVIVGSGSVSFEMIRYLTERLPIMIAPSWVRTRIQPIAIRDVIAYLSAAVEHPETADRIIEIGGADVLTYRQLMERFAAIRGLNRRIIEVPFFTPTLSSHWVHFVTPIPSSIARALIKGLENEVIVRDGSARELFPAIEPMGYDEAVQRALDRSASTGPQTTWFDAYTVRALPAEFTGSSEGMFIDRRERTTTASQRAVFGVVTSLGGERGWLYLDALWSLRGVLDRLVGGYGTRRGRRDPHDLRVGDAVDFWRVEAYRPFELLRLRAEMRLPGRAWLQFEITKRDDGSTCLQQTAFYESHGLFGALYWFGVLPFHAVLFGGLARRICEIAEVDTAAAATTPVQAVSP